jgi:NAD(P)-dependent dehydrogenase (short-subunit alcohol dehydrogenase family)
MLSGVSDLSDKIALITGAASGMGAACARELAGSGAAVIAADLDEPGAAATAESLGGHSIAGDISDPSFGERAVAKVVELHGRLDILVNAAGVMARLKAVDTDDATWQRVTRVNLDGTFYMCRAALRQMQTQGSGAIVNFSSIWGLWAGASSAAYSASKGGVSVLTRALALDHAPDGIRVNAVLPGDVDTPLLRAGGRSVPLTDEDIARMGESIPVRRVARPEEIAKVVAFLASDDASYVTGVLLPVDGGYAAQ